MMRSILEQDFQNVFCNRGDCGPLAQVAVQQRPVYSMSSECSQKDALPCF